MERTSGDGGWRGSPDIWLNVAYDALLEGGVDAVRIQVLAKTLDLSRTSFYWFFKDRDALLAALIERWRETNTRNIVLRSQAYAETIAEAMLNVFDCWLDRALFDAPFEFAVRSWALQSEDTLREVQEADRDRLAALGEMFKRFGFAESEADVRARTVYLVQIGYISMQTREDSETRLRRLPDYVEIFTGTRPLAREFDRFRSRHMAATG
ncbi:TetR/AcrR family transcriptional regulator [Aureimonas mangrovi]|uniref:TetR/AcrR family transcriptional regulator n=1 Tax=Aureimonas mangrovi TaxID=2758041 RepID=UPI00163DC19E|nr:TetR/AcrR family transcriptional regulator [Aureimonas mangrovi]